MKRIVCLLLILGMSMALTGCSFDTSGLNRIDHGESASADKVYAYEGDTITWTMQITLNKLYGGSVPEYDRDFVVYKDDVIYANSGIIKSKTFSVNVTKAGSYYVKVYLRDGNELHEGYSAPTVVMPPLDINGVNPDKTSGKTGESITWTAVAAGGWGSKFGYKYSWGVRRGGDVVAVSGGWKTVSTHTYEVTEPGDYSAEVWVSDGVSSVTAASITTAMVQQLSISSVSVKKLGKEEAAGDKTIAVVGETIRWFANAEGGNIPKYEYVFDIYRDGILIEDNSFAGNKFKGWTYPLTATGSYYAKAGVYDGKNYAYRNSPVTVVRGPLAITSVKANRTSAPVGAEIIWTITTSGGLDPKSYGFLLFKDYQTAGGTNTTSSNAYTHQASSAGDYYMRGFVSDGVVAAPCTMDSAHIKVSVSSALAVKSVHADRTKAYTGDMITWTAAAMGGSGNKQFKFNVYKDNSLLKSGSYTSAAQLSFQAVTNGIYKAGVYVKDSKTATSSPVYSEETVVAGLMPLSGTLPLATPELAFELPDAMDITLPDKVLIAVTPAPATPLKQTPMPVPATDYPIFVVITGILFLTPTPTARID